MSHWLFACYFIHDVYFIHFQNHNLICLYLVYLSSLNTWNLIISSPSLILRATLWAASGETSPSSLSTPSSLGVKLELISLEFSQKVAVGDVEVGNFTGRLHHPGFRGSTRVVSDVGSGMSSTPRPEPRVPALIFSHRCGCPYEQVSYLC